MDKKKKSLRTNVLQITKMKYKTKLAIKKTDKTPIKKKGMITGRYYK